MDPNAAKRSRMDRNQALSGGTAGGVCRDGGCKGKRKSLPTERIKHRQVYGFGFCRPRNPFCATGALWDASHLFRDHFSNLIASKQCLRGGQLCHEVWNPRPQKPQIKSFATEKSRYGRSKTQKTVAVSEEKSSSVPAGPANFPAAGFLAGKCPNLGRDSISRCRKIGESFSSSVEICRKTFPPEGNFGQPQHSRVFQKTRRRALRNAYCVCMQKRQENGTESEKLPYESFRVIFRR